jgi:hypothetical protein
MRLAGPEKPVAISIDRLQLGSEATVALLTKEKLTQ